MTETTDPATATSIATPDTNHATTIGWDHYTRNWTKRHANEHWPADFWKPQKGDYYQHQNQQNMGLKNGPRWWNQTYINAWSNRDLIEHLSGHLELLSHQQTQAVPYFLAQDLGLWGIRRELVAWSVCAYVLHSDPTDERRAHPLTETGEKAEQFWEAAYHLDLPMKDRVKTYHKVQSDMESTRGRGVY